MEDAIEEGAGRVGVGPARRTVLAAAAVGLGAVLLFLAEPLIARRLLPRFGGTAAVWTACVLCFQWLLLLGYAAAHGLRRLAPAPRRRVQAGVLGLAALSLALPEIAPGLSDAGGSPVLPVVLTVLSTIGLPFLVLSSTGPNVARILGGTPYRLYALSNAASLVALLVYPVFVEPALTLTEQLRAWSVAFVVYVALAAALVRLDAAPAAVAEAGPRGPRPWGRWIALSAVPSGLFLAVTHHLSTNIAPMPLLWVVPLAVYLLTLILCFDHPRWYRRHLFVGLLPWALGLMAVSQTNAVVHGELGPLVAMVCLALFWACMTCHGELARLRPAAEGLTAFYLALALGGALGGVFVGALAPVVFEGPHELPILVLGTAGVVWSAWRCDPPSDFRIDRVFGAFLAVFFGLYACVAVALDLNVRSKSLVRVRSPYGVIRVSEITVGGEGIRSLIHGTIRHGAQRTSPEHRHEPATYYMPTSGVGRALAAVQARGPIHMGVLGLGAGSLADWARAGDRVRFYEIDPEMERIARTWFFALPEARAEVSVAVGDGRAVLAAESPQAFDVLVLDAFSSDAIPTHLLTREAFEIYRRHLAPGGLLAVHISNRFVGLEPVLAAEAVAGGWAARLVSDAAGTNWMQFASRWVLLAAEASAFDAATLEGSVPLSDPPLERPWTDDHAPLWTLFKL
jgi:SAM-dependent methyltransferase